MDNEISYPKVNLEHIKYEIRFWESIITCYVLGASPLFGVMNGLVHRIWVDTMIQKVAVLINGVFLVKFDLWKPEMGFYNMVFITLIVSHSSLNLGMGIFRRKRLIRFLFRSNFLSWI